MSDLIDALPGWLIAAQRGLLQVLHALGLAGDAAGQPAWPFASRIAVETLVLDHALARQLLLCLAASAALLLAVGVAMLMRRIRWPLLAVAVFTAAVAPWPSPALLRADAVPTSFHRSPTGFTAASIERGLVVYQQQCASCHGPDGRGDTPVAATLPVWPPQLSGGLLWKRAEGETHWKVLHGTTDRAGRATMPAFAQSLSTADAWAVLDGLKAMASGQGLQAEGRWRWPVPAPDLRVRCGDGPELPLSHWRGQRVRIVAAGNAVALREDARFVTVALGGPSGAGCVAAEPQARQAFAVLSGTDEAGLAGMQFIVDRAGWLRARGRPGDTGWRASDLLCSSTDAPSGEGGLDALIRRIDADPVRADHGAPAPRG